MNFEHCIAVERDLVYPKWDDDEGDPHVENLIKALYGELGGLWRWTPADWNPQGLLVANNAKSGESAKRKRSSDHVEEMQKRQYPESVSVADDGFKRFEGKIKKLFEECIDTLTAEMKLGFEQTDVKFRCLTTKVVSIEETIREMKEASRHAEPEEPKEPKELEESAKKVAEEKVGDNTATSKRKVAETATTSKDKDRVSTDPSKKSPSRKKNQPARSSVPDRVMRNRRKNKKYL